MNKRQKEVLQSAMKDEEAIFKALESNYTAALADVKRNIKELQANPLTQSKAYQLEFQMQLEKQISGILDNLQGKNFTSIADYLNTAYRNGFLGSMYDMQGQGVPLVIPIDERQVLTAVQKTGDDFKLSNKLGVSTKKLKEQVQQELMRGLASQLTYQQIARNISDYGQSDMHRSMNIARTEGHRVQNQARFDSMTAASKKGANIVKQWDATLDGKTRTEHGQLDGQVRELDEDFTVAGYSAKYPGAFGDPYMDCNCRCCMLQRARWAVENVDPNTGELTEGKYQKWNNETGGFIECSGFEDFKEKYLKAADTLKKQPKSDIIKQTGIKTLDSAKMLDKHDIDDCYNTTNPLYSSGRQYKENCQRCVSAYEARRRGYDVTASERIFDGTDTLPYMMNQKGWANVYENGIASLNTPVGSRSATIKQSIESMMTSYGDGARAIVRVQWRGGGGHVFIAEQVNGVTQFIDPQSGERDCSYYFNAGMIKPTSTRLLRIDDKSFTDLIEKCIVVK